MPDVSTADPSSPAPRRKRRWGRILLITGGSLVLLLVVLVALAPTIAGAVAPGIAEGSINAMINGKAKVSKVDLSWSGAQHIGPVEITDEKGTRVASVTLTLSKGLLALSKAAMGSLDVGEVKVAGSANLVRNADGTLNISKLLKPQPATASAPKATSKPATPGEPIKLPNTLNASLVLDAIEVTYTDLSKGASGAPPAVGSIHIPKLAGSAAINAGKVNADITGNVLYGPGADAKTPGGTLAIKATADHLTDSKGVLTLDQAAIDAKVDLSDLAIAAADAIAGTGTGLVKAIGPTLKTSLAVKGNAGKSDITINVVSSGVNADLALAMNQGVLTASRPGVIEIKTDGARQLLGVDAMLAKGGQLTIERLPDIKVSLDNLKLNLPFDAKDMAPKPLDLRGSSMSASIATTPMAGSVRVPNPDGSAGAARPFAVAPLAMKLESADFAGTIALKGGTSATLNAQPAGQFNVDVVATKPLDDAGAPRAGGPKDLKGEVRLSQLATAIAQPFVESAGIDLAKGVGPTLDLALVARADPSGAADGAIPPTDIDLSITSTGLNAHAALEVDAKGLRARDDKGSLTIASLQALAGKAASKSGISMTTPGSLAASLKTLNVPLDARGGVNIDQAQLDASMTLSTISLALAPKPGQPASDPVTLDSLAITAGTQPGKAPALSIKGAGSQAKNAFTIDGAFDMLGLKPIIAGAKPATTLRPNGSLKVENLPTSLVGMFVASAPATPGASSKDAAAKPGPDLPRLISDAIGPALNITLATTPKGAAGKDGSDGVDLSLDVGAKNLTGKLAASADTSAIALSTLDFRTALSPELAASLLDSLGSKLESKPTLAGPAAITLAASPFKIPLKSDLSPDFTRAGDADIKLQIAGTTLVRNIVVKDEAGVAKDLGPLGVQDVLVSASVPLKALAAGSAPSPAKFVVTAGVLGDETHKVVDLKANAQMNLAAGAPQGDLSANLDLGVTDAAKLESILGKPGLLTGSIGQTLQVKGDALVSFPPPGTKAEASPISKATLNATITGPRLSTAKPLRMSTSGQALAIEQPMILNWKMAPEFANGYLLKIPAQAPAKGKNATPESIRFAEAIDTTLTIERLAINIPKTADEGPLKPGVFSVDLNLRAPTASFIVAGVPTSVKEFVCRIAGGSNAGKAGIKLTILDAGQGMATDAKGKGVPAVDFTIGLANAYDAKGNPTPDAAELNVDGAASKISTALVDALAQQHGVLAEALGPTAAMTLKADKLSKTSGSIDFTANSPRATMTAKGDIKNGAFVAQGQPTIKLLEITKALSSKFTDGLPNLASIEKKPEDGPALIQASGLSVPINGNMAALNGDVSIDLGQARFETSDTFGKLLNKIGAKSSATIGQHIDPFVVNLKNGVATYQRFTLPLGEFKVATEGTVDLVKQELDVVTYVPFGALTDEAAGRFNSGLGSRLSGLTGGVLEKTTMMPFRTKGTFEKHDTKPDLELFIKQAGKSLIDTPKNLGEGLKDLLKGKKDKDK
jgi:hypothetical protein